MNILALDIATKTGWALRTPTGVISGVQSFELKRGDSDGMRFLRFERWLYDMVRTPETPDVDLIVYEQGFFRGGAPSAVCGGLIAHMLKVAAACNVQHSALPATSLKKFATGSGKADKSAMIAAARRRFPDQTIQDDNQADALMLLAWGIAEFDGKAARREPEMLSLV